MQANTPQSSRGQHLQETILCWPFPAIPAQSRSETSREQGRSDQLAEKVQHFQLQLVCAPVSVVCLRRENKIPRKMMENYEQLCKEDRSESELSSKDCAFIVKFLFTA